MPNPLSMLITLQLTILDRCLAMTRGMFDLYFSLQPAPVKVAPTAPSRSLVVLDQSRARHPH